MKSPLRLSNLLMEHKKEEQKSEHTLQERYRARWDLYSSKEVALVYFPDLFTWQIRFTLPTASPTSFFTLISQLERKLFPSSGESSATESLCSASGCGLRER